LIDYIEKEPRARTFAAEVSLSALAEFAFAAFCSVEWDDMVADFDARYTLADGLNLGKQT
jgi:hypothetical protein